MHRSSATSEVSCLLAKGEPRNEGCSQPSFENIGNTEASVESRRMVSSHYQSSKSNNIYESTHPSLHKRSLWCPHG